MRSTPIQRPGTRTTSRTSGLHTNGVRTAGALLIAAAMLVAGLGALAGCAGTSDEASTEISSEASTEITVAPAAPAATVAAGFYLITPDAANELVSAAPEDLVVLDVRTPDEFAAGHLTGAQLLDFQSSTFADDLATLPRDATYLVYCHSGNRSAQAVAAMQQLDFTSVYEIEGGVTAWQAAGFTVTR